MRRLPTRSAGTHPRAADGAPSPPEARRRLRGEDRRAQLLSVAIDVFADRGFHATSMEEVAEAAGVTKPVLYHHFSSKRALYLQLLEDVGRRLQEEITEATAVAAGPRQQVEAGFTAYFRFVERHASAFRLLFGGGDRRDEQFADAVRQVEDGMAQVIADLIDADISPAHRRALAAAVVDMAEGAGRRALRRLPTDPAATGTRKRIDDEVEEEGGDEGVTGAPDLLARQLAELTWAGLRGIGRPDQIRPPVV